jgi:hypothetical protein
MASSAPNGSSISSTEGSSASARDADALLHPAGNLVRIVVLEAAETDQPDHLGDPGGSLARLVAAHLEPEADILLDRAPGEQIEMLKDHGARLVRPGDIAAVEAHRPAGRHVEPVHDAQQRGLAAAARSDERDELARLGGKADRVQHLQRRAAGAIREGLAHVVDRKGGRHERPRTRTRSTA